MIAPTLNQRLFSAFTIVDTMSSVATPPASGSPSTPSAEKQPAENMSKAELDTSIIEYLRARGYHDVADAFDTSLRDEKGKKSVVDTEALRKALEPRLKESANLLNELTTMTSPANLQNLLLNLGSGLDDILSTDPSDRHEGFKELESWVEGSLDMYRVRAELAKNEPTHVSCSPNSDPSYSQFSAISILISSSVDSKMPVYVFWKYCND